MIAEVTTAALMSENKHLANPCTTDSTPTSANQEDHVSMAAHAARRLGRMNANLNTILGVEAICAAQGIEFRAPLKTSAPLQRVHGPAARGGAGDRAGPLPRPRSGGGGGAGARGDLAAAAGLELTREGGCPSWGRGPGANSPGIFPGQKKGGSNGNDSRSR